VGRGDLDEERKQSTLDLRLHPFPSHGSKWVTGAPHLLAWEASSLSLLLSPSPSPSLSLPFFWIKTPSEYSFVLQGDDIESHLFYMLPGTTFIIAKHQLYHERVLSSVYKQG
jgi:hypothetical protein